METLSLVCWRYVLAYHLSVYGKVANPYSGQVSSYLFSTWCGLALSLNCLLQTPVTSSPIVAGFLSNLPAYRIGVNPLLRGVEIGLVHGLLVTGIY